VVNDRSSQTWTNTDAYEAIIGRWSRPAADAALGWLAPPTGLDWLDIGCGTGALIEAVLAKATPSSVLGIDPATEFLELARAQIPDDRVSFQTGNASSLPVPDDSFDVVISGLVLHFVSDLEGALREKVRAARTGGTVAGYLWALANTDQFTRPFWRAANAIDPGAKAWDVAHTQQVKDLEGLIDLFSGASLEQVSGDHLSFPVTFRDFNDYWQPCLLEGNSPIQRYAHSLPPDRQTVLRERLRTELPIASDGSIPLSGNLWIARGTKCRAL
jgi:SAM-dependent methyltransferase